MLDKAGKTIDDVDRVEINEAFSSVTVNSLKMLGADPERERQRRRGRARPPARRLRRADLGASQYRGKYASAIVVQQMGKTEPVPDSFKAYIDLNAQSGDNNHSNVVKVVPTAHGGRMDTSSDQSIAGNLADKFCNGSFAAC